VLQCKDCEFFSRDEKTGRIMLRCDPFSNVKEPACVEKQQLLRLDGLLRAYYAQLRWYQKLGPMQEKMFELMKREMQDLDDSDSWKEGYDDEDQGDECGGDEDELQR